jgi:hypothetical protein
MRSILRILLSAAVILSVCPAQAQQGDDLARAKTHFEAGQALYRLGNYTEAIREFSAGYQLAPKPQFLINIGQAYLKLGDLEKARDMYKRYLVDTPASDPNRAAAEEMLSDINRQIAERPAPTPAPSPSGPTAIQSPQLAVTATPPEKPFVKRHWWIFPVGAVVLAGVAVGVYFGVRPTQVGCGDASLGCVTVTSTMNK